MTHPAPGAFSCWCMYHHAIPGQARTHLGIKKQKRDLVRDGGSHGILVYSGDEPVGWCQFGPREELPLMDRNRRYRRLATAGGQTRMWRITCFTVRREHRKRGVASVALRAALDEIRRRGGGLVEAYPITHRGAYREYLGSVSMFKNEGFKIVAPFGESNVVMQKLV